MTAQTQTTAAQAEQQPSNKELNFRALEAKFQRELAAERAEKERLVKELEEKTQANEEPEIENDPYVDHKKLAKKLDHLGKTTQTDIQKAMEIAKKAAKDELKQEMWLDNNKDFYEVMKNADKLYEKDQELAETILQMPDTFERQKLVYKNIKALGLHKPPEKESEVQKKVNANQRSPYYQPSGISSAPYSQVADFSPAGQKQAYNKLQELKSKLRI
jgi:hypothetical protein